MEQIRKPFQGIGNITRFNWHLYAWAIGAVGLLLGISQLSSGFLGLLLTGLAVGIIIGTLLSWIVSYYVCDRSDLYAFTWLTSVSRCPPSSILTFMLALMRQAL